VKYKPIENHSAALGDHVVQCVRAGLVKATERALSKTKKVENMNIC